MNEAETSRYTLAKPCWERLVSVSRNSALTAALRAAWGEGLLVSFYRNSALTAALRAFGEGLLVSFYRNSVLTASLRVAVLK